MNPMAAALWFVSGGNALATVLLALQGEWYGLMTLGAAGLSGFVAWARS